MAIQRFERGEFSAAIDLFLDAIRADAGNPPMHFNLALALAKLGESEAALAAIKDGLDINPHDKQALKLLGMLHAIIKKAREKDARPGPVPAWVGRYLKSKDFMANHHDGNIAGPIIASMLASPESFHHVIEALHGKGGRVDRQVGPFMNKAQLDLYHGAIVMCHASLSLPCLSGNDAGQMLSYILDHYETLDDADRGTGLLWVFEQGRRKYENADYTEAARILENLVAVEPTNLAILFYCGKALRDSSEPEMIERSVEYYKRILQLNPENALGWYDLSLSYAMLGDFQRELFCLQRAYELGHSRQDADRITYLQGITAPQDPFE